MGTTSSGGQPTDEAWIEDWRCASTMDRERLVESLYPQLRRLVGHHLARRQRAITLQTTELIHELYLQLAGQRQMAWRDRTHFFAIAGRLLRRIVVDHERHRRRQKRGGDRIDLGLEEALEVAVDPGLALTDVLTLDHALDDLEVIDSRAARVVELRYFAGLDHDETAEALDIGRATVHRSWRFARAWLRGRLEGSTGSEAGA